MTQINFPVTSATFVSLGPAPVRCQATTVAVKVVVADSLPDIGTAGTTLGVNQPAQTFAAADSSSQVWVASLGADTSVYTLTLAGIAGSSGSGTATAVAGAATLNKQNGTITSEALTGATTYTLTLTNSVILSTSTVLVNLTNSANLAVAPTGKTVTAGQVVVAASMAALTGTVIIDFAVFN